MTQPLVVCQFNNKPHTLDEECQRVHEIPQWLLDQGRLDCEHAGYGLVGIPGLLVCRCLICARCQNHTGNANQGHYWAYCKVTRTTREFHFCCDGDCELEEKR